MANGKPSYIAADVYSVKKEMTGRVMVGAIPLVYRDADGNPLLTAKVGGFTGGKAMLTDANGNAAGSIQKKFALGSAKYQFFDANGQQIGQVTIKSGLMGTSENISMQDPNGNVVASATGNFAGFNYEITDPQGKSLAKIYRDVQKGQQQQGSGLKGMLGSIAMQAASAAMSMGQGSYKIEILQKSINDASRLFILELVAVLDEMYQPKSGMGGNMGFGIGGGNIKI